MLFFHLTVSCCFLLLLFFRFIGNPYFLLKIIQWKLTNFCHFCVKTHGFFLGAPLLTPWQKTYKYQPFLYKSSLTSIWKQVERFSEKYRRGKVTRKVLQIQCKIGLREISAPRNLTARLHEYTAENVLCLAYKMSATINDIPITGNTSAAEHVTTSRLRFVLKFIISCSVQWIFIF